MRHLILAVLLFFTFGFANAQITKDNLKGFDKLSEAQKAEVVKFIEGQKDRGENVVPAKTAETVKAWAGVGAELGKGLVATAKELGVAVNDFIKTPVGIMTASAIFWHYMGRDVLHLVIGVCFFLIYYPTWIYLFRRLLLVKEVQYVDGEKKKIKARTIYNNWSTMPDGGLFMAFVTGAAGILLTLILLLG